MNLTATTHALELVTAAATAVVYSVSWTDIDKSGASTVATPGSAQGSISSATTTTIVSAPGASIYRVVTSLSVKATGGAQAVSVQKDVSGTNYPLPTASLATDESLHYEDAHGWYVLDATGSRKGVGATGADGVDGGGTILGSGTSIIDFGSGGASHATLAVTGQAAILSGSLVYCWIKPEATADHSADEHLVETIKVFASNVTAGVGFTLHALNTSDAVEPDIPSWALLGRSSGTGGVPGPGQAARKNLPNRGGKGTLIRGQWSVGWMYTQ